MGFALLFFRSSPHNPHPLAPLQGDATRGVAHRFSAKGWVLDQTSIFALVDAFVQRCKDLLEVCDCQQQFARREEGKQMPLPCFAGRQGAEVTRSLLEMEATFDKSINILRSVRKGILDVKNTSWHDDYNRFRAGVKDLEVMMQNLINSAFETLSTVEEGVQLLDVFHHLSAREAIKRTIDRKTVDVYGLFNKELSLVNKELSRKTFYLPVHMPQRAGQAHWARALRRRIDKPMERAHFMPHIGSGEEVCLAHAQLVQTLDELVRRIFSEWSQSLDRQSLKRLEQPLMVRSRDCEGLLDINFDRGLLNMFNEIHYWERLLFEIPHYVSEVYQRREELRNLRENVLLVVRDYNRQWHTTKAKQTKRRAEGQWRRGEKRKRRGEAGERERRGRGEEKKRRGRGGERKRREEEEEGRGEEEGEEKQRRGRSRGQERERKRRGEEKQRRVRREERRGEEVGEEKQRRGRREERERRGEEGKGEGEEEEGRGRGGERRERGRGEEEERRGVEEERRGEKRKGEERRRGEEWKRKGEERRGSERRGRRDERDRGGE
ncbi:hypothetical protein ACEWY4_024816 [Coilia grayii]|uniref:Dynein heavy chain tail domain-containing protein n=1 Tax=Coilia grayii TaxID=363190 RepID=A0ABD1IVS6_9TELE